MARKFTLHSAGQSLRNALNRAGAALNGRTTKLNTISVGDKALARSPKSLRSKADKNQLKRSRRKKIKKVLMIIGGIVLISGVLFTIFAFAKIQEISAKLPPVDDPFRSKETASVIYDRYGIELYKVFDQFNRDPVNLEAIPHQVRWAFLAAEDSDFYTHQGFDILSIISCTVKNVLSRSIQCGGSTVTQQMVKLTLDQAASTIERKISEILMAAKVEQAYSKDEILQMYLTVAPFGSNIYGLTSAANFYFGKSAKDLTLAQAALLAAIVQSPARLSPTVPFDKDLERAQADVKDRQAYVLSQAEQKMQQINSQHRANVNDPEAPDLFTPEIIQAAKDEVLEYRPPIFGDKKSGHFVDLVISELQTKNYKNGEEPFTATDLQTAGLRIYTTLDYNLQVYSENAVLNAVNANANRNIHNGALVLTKPSTGEIFALVGSKGYNLPREGCDGNSRNCLFDPQVNVMNTLQSPGSSTKPMGYYEAYRQGKLFPGSLLPDIALKIPGYSIQNALSNFIGVGPDANAPAANAAEMLRSSRNLPAIMLVQLISVQRFVETMREFGYTTYEDMSQYGPSVILGGSDVKGLEHAQGYGVFANGGDLVPYETIIKIEDRNGKILWEAKPQPERKRVADPQAVYLLNQSLRNNYGFSFDGRDVADKTGTSENYQDLWIGAYSPDMVVVAWMGNNNNAELPRNTFAANIIVPWTRTYFKDMAQNGNFNFRTPFARPAGVRSSGGFNPNAEGEFSGVASGFIIDGKNPPTDVVRKKLLVCKDQTDRIARQVDIDMGMAEERYFNRYVMQTADFQSQFDDDFRRRYGRENKIPDQECTVDRTSLSFAASVQGSSFAVQGQAFFVGSTVDYVRIYWNEEDNGHRLGSGPNNPAVNADGTFSATYNGQIVPGPGTYTLIAVARAMDGRELRREVSGLVIPPLVSSSSSSSGSSSSASSTP